MPKLYKATTKRFCCIHLCHFAFILTDLNDAAIANMVVALGESMGLTVIAEGVETESQKDFLAKLGCNNYQGYLFNKPAPIDEFEAFAA
jgi:EAL domain-containing protein (putative c-di-GMP-specific phosphodiesterase class I)